MQHLDLPPLNRKLYDYIKANYANVQQFANRVGTSQQVVNRLFNIDAKSGKYPSVSSSLINKIVSSLGLDYEWFIVDDIPFDCSHAPKGTDNSSRLERLKIAQDYLKLTGRIKSNFDISIAMGKKHQNINLVFSGRIIISEQFLYAFNKAFDNLFKITWLINGEGDFLAEKVKKDADINEIIRAKDDEIASLKQMLNEASIEIIKLNSELRKLKEG